MSSVIAKRSAFCNTLFRICVSSDIAKKRMCSGTVFRVSCPATVAENTLFFFVLHSVREAILVIGQYFGAVWGLCGRCFLLFCDIWMSFGRYFLSLHLLHGRYLATVLVVWGGSSRLSVICVWQLFLLLGGVCESDLDIVRTWFLLVGPYLVAILAMWVLCGRYLGVMLLLFSALGIIWALF